MTDLTRLTRKPDRADSSRDLLDALLYDVLVGTLSSVQDGEPWAVPIFFGRDGDRVILHGSSGAGMLRHLKLGAPVVFSVFSLDAMVVAHTAFESSANYRSATIRGRAEALGKDELDAAMNLMSNRLIPGRMAEVPANTKKELAATAGVVLEITADNWIYKERTGQAGEPEEGAGETTAWAGVVPLTQSWGEPQRDDWVPADRPVPDSVLRMVDAPVD